MFLGSDESLKSLEPSGRLCYFEGERKLRFFERRGCDNKARKDFRDHGQTEKFASCSCFLPCNSISYDIEIRESKLKENE